MKKYNEQNDDNKKDIIINELVIRSVDRSRKDILTWRNALISAESVYYPNRCRLYDMYEDVILDGHLSGIINKRMDAVLNKELYFEKEGKKNTSFDSLIQSDAFRKLMLLIMETRFWGITGIEFIPGKFLDFEAIPRKHIKPELSLIAYEQSGIEGVAYTNVENIWVIGEKKDLGLLLKCASYALYKRGGMADWAQYLELFGQPVRIIKYDSYDEQTKSELKKVLDASGSSLSMMIPRQADFEIKDGKQSNGDGNLQLKFINAMNDEMSITVLGNTETTTSSTTSGYAQSKVHLEQQYEITGSDMNYMIGMLNHPKFIKVLHSYGFNANTGKFVFVKEKDIDYLKARMEIDKEIALHVPIPLDYWYNTYGVDKI